MRSGRWKTARAVKRRTRWTSGQDWSALKRATSRSCARRVPWKAYPSTSTARPAARKRKSGRRGLPSPAGRRVGWHSGSGPRRPSSAGPPSPPGSPTPVRPAAARCARGPRPGGVRRVPRRAPRTGRAPRAVGLRRHGAPARSPRPRRPPPGSRRPVSDRPPSAPGSSSAAPAGATGPRPRGRGWRGCGSRRRAPICRGAVPLKSRCSGAGSPPSTSMRCSRAAVPWLHTSSGRRQPGQGRRPQPPVHLSPGRRPRAPADPLPAVAAQPSGQPARGRPARRDRPDRQEDPAPGEDRQLVHTRNDPRKRDTSHPLWKTRRKTSPGKRKYGGTSPFGGSILDG
ncbi:hypothetical protein STANM309S_01615 [Streptomyces tanashiensis]